jgi:DNA repair ATPase RecN
MTIAAMALNPPMETGTVTFMITAQIAQQHRQAGSDLWLIREECESLLADITMGQQPLDELLKRRDDLIKRLYEVYRGAPSTMPKAYKKAQEALQKLEDMTFSDAEIDKFLPKELKSKAAANPKL